MERVDVVELEPVVLDVARASEPVNHDVMTNPKVHVTIGDARETLLTSRDRYDVIASEPSNPFRAGIASLFTLEFYRAASARLTEDGVFAQWVQAYEIDAPHAAHDLRDDGRRVSAGRDVADQPRRPRAARHRAAPRLQRGGARAPASPKSRSRRRSPTPGAPWTSTACWRIFSPPTRWRGRLPPRRGVEINTDDRNVVEFGLARSVGRSGSVLVAEIRELARAIGASRPPLDSDAGIEWPAVQTAWANFVEWDAQTRGMRPETSDEGAAAGGAAALLPGE